MRHMPARVAFTREIEASTELLFNASTGIPAHRWLSLHLRLAKYDWLRSMATAAVEFAMSVEEQRNLHPFFSKAHRMIPLWTVNKA